MSTHPPAPPAATTDVFALLEYILSSARLRLAKEAKPIAFALDGDGGTWLFDPSTDGALFREAGTASIPDDVLRVHCAPDLLLRLATADDFALKDDDTAWFEGDVEDLLPLATVLEASANVLGIRFAGKTSTPSSSKGGAR